MLQETDMFIDIYARSMYRATLHSDLPLEPLPPYQGAGANPKSGLLKRLRTWMCTPLQPPLDRVCCEP